MTIVNQRWPRTLCPESCRFGRSRNDILQASPRTRYENVIVQGRPLWTAELSWRVPVGPEAMQLRYLLDGVDGYRGSVQIWDFSLPRPEWLVFADERAPQYLYWSNVSVTGLRFTWNGLPSHWTYDATVSAGATRAIGDTTIALSSLAANTLAVLQGQHVQIGRRLYVADNSYTSSAGGTVTIGLTTPLLSAVAVNDPVRLVDAGCEMRLASQEWQGGRSAGDGFYSVSARFIETVRDYA